MLFDRLITIGIGRVGHTMICEEVLSKIAGLTLLDPTGHIEFAYYTNRCAELGIEVPPAFVFVRNPFEWYACVWCWQHRHGGKYIRSFSEYMELVKANPATPSWFRYRSFSRSWEMHNGAMAKYIGRYENIYNDVVRIVTALIPDLVTAERVRELVETAPYRSKGKFANGEPLGDYHQYYDEKTKRIVYDLDGALLDRFDYHF